MANGAKTGPPISRYRHYSPVAAKGRVSRSQVPDERRNGRGRRCGRRSGRAHRCHCDRLGGCRNSLTARPARRTPPNHRSAGWVRHRSCDARRSGGVPPACRALVGHAHRHDTARLLRAPGSDRRWRDSASTPSVTISRTASRRRARGARGRAHHPHAIPEEAAAVVVDDERVMVRAPRGSLTARRPVGADGRRRYVAPLRHQDVRSQDVSRRLR